MLLTREELIPFVQSHFQNRDRYLGILAASPPPCYLLETEILRERAAQFRQAFQDKFQDCGFFFAMKSNNHPRVSETILEAGFGLDVSSGSELAMAIDLKAREIVFSGPGKTNEELRLAVQHADRVIVLIDGFSELRRLNGIAADMGSAIRAGIRLTTNPSGLWRKFGISPELLPDFLDQARQCSHVELKGLQFHTSWNLTPLAQMEFIADLGRTLAKLSAQALDGIDFVDIGGGYWPEQGEWLHHVPGEAGPPSEKQNPLVHYRLPAAPIHAFAAQLHEAIHAHLQPILPCRICFEPGRWICNDAMHLLLSVIDKKAPDLVVTSGGINAVGWDRFETDYFPVLNLSRPSLEERPCNILGSLCTPHDVFGRSYFGADILPGDVLMIPCQGAYTYSLRQQFIKPIPDVIVV